MPVEETTRHTLSIIQMFQNSDLFMKLLILGLLFASLWCWAIIFEKRSRFKKMRQSMDDFSQRFFSGMSLVTLATETAKNITNPLAAVFVGAMKEFQRLGNRKKALTVADAQQQLEKNMQITIERQITQLETHMLFLGSTGSVAPLLGLFGTVWGIMDSFNAIGFSQNTNITAVAPGVAEALLTTAVGLIAAIPALIAYNKFSADINHFSRDIETFADELEDLMMRQVEE